MPPHRSYRLELEVMEARELPSTSIHGGRPDPFVKVTFTRHNVSHRTGIVTASSEPIWSQKFILDGCGETEDIVFVLNDRDDGPRSFMGRKELTVGGPCRSVGMRWLALDGGPCQLRVAWEMKESEPSAATASDTALGATPAGVINANIVATAVQQEGISEPPPPTHLSPARKQSSSSSGVGGGLTIPDILSELQSKLYEFMGETRERLMSLESRVIEIESAFRGVQSLQQMSSSSPHMAATSMASSNNSRRVVKQLDPTTLVSATTAIGVGATSPVGKMKITQETRSALESIASNPTRLSAMDEQMLANYKYEPIGNLGGSSKGSHRSQNTTDQPLEGSAAAAAASSDFFSRRLEAAGANVDFAAKMMSTGSKYTRPL